MFSIEMTPTRWGRSAWARQLGIVTMLLIRIATFFFILATHQVDAATSAQAERLPAAVVLPSSLPVQREVDSSFADGNISGAMVVCVILLGALLFYVRIVLNRKKHPRRAGGSEGKPWSKWLGKSIGDNELRIVSSTALSSLSRLYVIEWNGNRYLLAQNDQAFNLLDKAEGSGAKSIAGASGDAQ